ncbi:hypothetical protein GF342_05555 [Candidatus Woesearchaeota archaeon]|nr:hypothetical protein [Candidatus Woesearchaeota archaeon]
MKLNPKMLMGIFIVAVMVLSIFGFVLNYKLGGSNSFDYNGFEFRQTQDGWIVELDGEEHAFFYHPTEVASLPLTNETINLLTAAKNIVISYNDEVEEPELLGHLQYYMELHISTQKIVTRATTTGENAVIAMTCENATRTSPIIILDITNTTSIEEDGPCLTVQGSSGAALAQQADRLQYVILGVMNE